MLRNPFAKHRPPLSSPVSTYADLFELMRYDRGLDVMPYAIGFRPKPPLFDPSGPEPNFALLDTDAEVEAFMQAFAQPIVFEGPGVVSPGPLMRWNDLPSLLMADTVVTAFAYPDDENQGWPYLQVFAIPPAMFVSGKARPQDTVRGRYNFRQFPPEDKQKYVTELVEARAKAGNVNLFIGGKIPFSVIDALNSHNPKDKPQ